MVAFFLDWTEAKVRGVDGFGIPDCPNGVRGSHLAIFPENQARAARRGPGPKIQGTGVVREMIMPRTAEAIA
jgi:hypothetical protein